MENPQAPIQQWFAMLISAKRSVSFARPLEEEK
jgi:hypothetical protein